MLLADFFAHLDDEEKSYKMVTPCWTAALERENSMVQSTGLLGQMDGPLARAPSALEVVIASFVPRPVSQRDTEITEWSLPHVVETHYSSTLNRSIELSRKISGDKVRYCFLTFRYSHSVRRTINCIRETDVAFLQRLRPRDHDA